jgi:hypothetical protein
MDIEENSSADIEYNFLSTNTNESGNAYATRKKR